MKFITSFILLIVAIDCFSQKVNYLAYDCPTGSYIHSHLFEKLILENKIDSASIILESWNRLCGEREVTVRAFILLQLIKEPYMIPILPENMLLYLDQYKLRINTPEEAKHLRYEYNLPYYSYIPINENFDKFTKKSFSNLKPIDDKDLKFIVETYSGKNPDIFSNEVVDSMPTNGIFTQYAAELVKIKKMSEGHTALLGGAWIPLNKGTTLGIHPEIGFQAGFKKSKFNYDFSLLIRFLKSKEEYIALRKQTGLKETSKNFFGGFVGLDFGYDIYAKKSNEVQLIAGAGFDGFDALKESGDLKSASIASYNFNFGISYRKYLHSNNYVGIKVKFNIIDYTLNKVVSFNESPVSISITCGIVKNYYKNYLLKKTNYKLRH